MTSYTATASASGFRSAQAGRPSGARWFSALRARRPVMQPVDYRRNGLTSHEELPMAYRADTAQPAAATSFDEPQAARAPRFVPYVAFFVTVFASVAAAAAVVTNELPLVMVGLL